MIERNYLKLILLFLNVFIFKIVSNTNIPTKSPTRNPTINPINPTLNPNYIYRSKLYLPFDPETFSTYTSLWRERHSSWINIDPISTESVCFATRNKNAKTVRERVLNQARNCLMKQRNRTETPRRPKKLRLWIPR